MRKKNINFDFNSDFNSYLAGLWEGGGHIQIQADLSAGSLKKKKYNPRFCIITHEKNKPWLMKIKSQLNNYGFIRYKKKEHALVLTISNIEGLLLIINKLNGNLKTPKIDKFYDLIDWVNNNKNLSIEKLPIDYNIKDNGWLAGFIEADGSFYIRCSEPKLSSKRKKARIAVRLNIYQRMLSSSGKSYELIFKEIANQFNGSLTIVTKKNNKQYYCLSFCSQKSTLKIKNYLDRHCLSSVKYLDYLNWVDALNIILNKNHLESTGINAIKYLKSCMNNSRSYFNWNHL